MASAGRSERFVCDPLLSRIFIVHRLPMNIFKRRFPWHINIAYRGRKPMPRKRTKEPKGPASDLALMVWLMDSPYLIMKALDGGCENATEVADKLGGKPIAWVSKRTGRMSHHGLIIKHDPDDHGFCRMELTRKGITVLRAIENINNNHAFVELRRSLELTSPGEDWRVMLWEEAEWIRRAMTSGDVEGCDLDRLFNMVQYSSSSKVESWYANNDLVWLLSNSDSERWNERSLILLLKMIALAINDSRADIKYATAFNGLVRPLLKFALDDDADPDVRIESIMAIGSMRDRHGRIPNDVYLALIIIQWTMLSKAHRGFDLMESTVADVLDKWNADLTDEQKEMMLRSVRRMLFINEPELDDLCQTAFEGQRREVREDMYGKYRSLVSMLLGRKIPES